MPLVLLHMFGVMIERFYCLFADIAPVFSFVTVTAWIYDVVAASEGLIIFWWSCFSRIRWIRSRLLLLRSSSGRLLLSRSRHRSWKRLSSWHLLSLKHCGCCFLLEIWWWLVEVWILCIWTNLIDQTISNTICPQLGRMSIILCRSCWLCRTMFNN